MPFKAKIGGNPCLAIIDNNSISVKYEKYQKSFEIPHNSIRCIQQYRNVVLINAQKNDKLVVYVIDSPAAKKIFKKITEKSK